MWRYSRSYTTLNTECYALNIQFALVVEGRYFN